MSRPTKSRENAPTGTTLSELDVEGLLRRPPRAARSGAVRDVGSLRDGGSLSSAERKRAEDAFRRLARQVERQVRESLAIAVKQCPYLPHDIACDVARDVESVSLPTLPGTEVLTDADCVAFVRGRIGQNRNTDGQRPRLTVTEQLASLISDHLRQALLLRHRLPARLADDIIVQGRERAIVELISPDTDESEVQRLVQQLHVSDRLTPTLLLRAVCMGNYALFEKGLAALAGIPTANARTLIHDAGSLGLKALCRRAELPADMYRAFRAAVDVMLAEEGAGPPEAHRKRRADRFIDGLMRHYEDIGPENLEAVFGKLSRHAAASARGLA